MMPTSQNLDASTQAKATLNTEIEPGSSSLKNPFSAEQTIYVPGNPLRRPMRLLAEISSDIKRSRGLVWRLFSRNLRSMHRQTVLGLFWVFLPPIAATAVWMFLKSQAGFQFDVGVSYLAYVMTGMILWQGFADAFQSPLNSVKTNKALLTKVNLPRESVLLAGLLEAAFHMTIRLIILLPVFMLNDIPFLTSQLAALAAVPLLMMFAAGIGMLICPFGTLYHDVGRFIAIALPFWMICTPIIYPTPDSFPARLTVYANPIGGPLVLIRDSLLGIDTASGIFATGFTLLLIAVPVFVTGLLVYRVSMPFVVERM